VRGLDLAHPLVYHHVLFCHVDYQENKQKMNYGNDGREQKGRNGKGSRDNMAN
jgi:hypothetical protein